MAESLPLDTAPIMAGRPFTRAEALADGIDAVAIRTLVRRGQIRRIVQGVYVDTGVQDSLELRAEALVKVLPDDSVICRQSAAWLYGIDTAALSDRSQVPRLEFVRPAKSRAVRTAGAGGHSQTLLGDDVVEIAGLRVTSPVATAVHLARHLRRPFALSALDAMARARLVAAYQVREAVRRYPHHPYIVQARELARVMDSRAESPGESWLRLRMIDAGFPPVVPQVEVRTPDQRFRVDLAFLHPLRDGRRLALEYDSDLWHGTRRQQLRDARRVRQIEAGGWVVLSIGRGQVWGTDPALENAVGDLLEVRPKLPRRW